MTAVTVSGDSRRAAHPWTIRIAQIGWWLMLALSLILFGPSVIQVYEDQRVVCEGAACLPDQLGVKAAHNLATIGWTTQAYARFTLGLSIVSMLIWLSIGVFIAWRKWHDILALVIAAQSVTQSVSQVISVQVFHGGPLFIPALVVSFYSGLLIVLVFALFPNGRFVPRWQRWVVLAYVFYDALATVPLTTYPASAQPVVMALANNLWFCLMGLILVGQVYRYRHVTSEVERQQTKWIVFAFVAVIVLQFAAYLPMTLSAKLGSPDSLYSLANNAVDTLILLIAPVCITIAIMRYRLFDIDVIIKRTLVYGALTAILAGMYFGLVIGAQQLTHRLTGQQAGQQPVVIVLTTLLIAALFTPLRARLQRWIDRRFDRSHYDAAKTLAAFSQTLRSEVDLRQLNEQLLDVVEETMRPETASLWLSPHAQARQNTTSVQ
jgi:hypothetical protein